jgi:hypothetical protein
MGIDVSCIMIFRKRFIIAEQNDGSELASLKLEVKVLRQKTIMGMPICIERITHSMRLCVAARVVEHDG